jgi:hypothetical protein
VGDTIKVRLLTSRADELESWVAGDEITVAADEAKALIDRGDAEPVARKQADQRETRASAAA